MLAAVDFYGRVTMTRLAGTEAALDVEKMATGTDMVKLAVWYHVLLGTLLLPKDVR